MRKISLRRFLAVHTAAAAVVAAYIFLPFGCCGILTIIDWFTVSKKTKELNFNNIMTIL